MRMTEVQQAEAYQMLERIADSREIRLYAPDYGDKIEDFLKRVREANNDAK